MKTLLVLISFSCCALAQDQARIVGTVSDPTGGVIARATVTATDERTGSNREVAADDNGFYIITNLNPSTYTIAGSGRSLGATEFKQVSLAVGQERTLN